MYHKLDRLGVPVYVPARQTLKREYAKRNELTFLPSSAHFSVHLADLKGGRTASNVVRIRHCDALISTPVGTVPLTYSKTTDLGVASYTHQLLLSLPPKVAQRVIAHL